MMDCAMLAECVYHLVAPREHSARHSRAPRGGPEGLPRSLRSKPHMGKERQRRPPASVPHTRLRPAAGVTSPSRRTAEGGRWFGMEGLSSIHRAASSDPHVHPPRGPDPEAGPGRRPSTRTSSHRAVNSAAREPGTPARCWAWCLLCHMDTPRSHGAERAQSRDRECTRASRMGRPIPCLASGPCFSRLRPELAGDLLSHSHKLRFLSAR